MFFNAERVMQKTLYSACFLVVVEGNLVQNTFKNYVNLVGIERHAKNIRNLSLL